MALTLMALRVNAGIDRQTAARILGISPETLGNWERGRCFPSVPYITKIEQLYGVSYADINFLPKNIGLTDGEQEMNVREEG